jgi:hypothetical protein
MDAKSIAFSVIGVGMLAIVFFLIRGPANPSTSREMGGVEGRVFLGPTCPVERIPPDPECAPRPYKTAITVSQSGDTAILKTIETDGDGKFTAELSPGSYDFTPSGGAVLPRCATHTVVIVPKAITQETFQCDTGIR